MSVLKAYFDASINQSSPVQEDFDRVVDYDENENEIVSWKKVDYRELQKSNGTVDMWSLQSLLKAGINPEFPIRTGYNTRLEGLDVLQQAETIANEILENKE